MNVIGLTGCNVHAMADAAELLLGTAVARAINVSVMLYVDEADQARALRANNSGATEIWRVGADPARSHLDPLVDAFIDDGAALSHDVAGQLARFAALIGAALPAPTFN
jgi:hypothetical protein